MADTIKISTVTAAIAAASISVTNAKGTSVTLAIKDTSAIPVAVNQMQCPMLAPKADGFVTNLSFLRDTFGADAALKTVKYTLNYVFYYAPVLQSVSLFGKYDEMVTAASAILLYFTTNTNLSGSTEFMVSGVPSFGAQTDGTLTDGKPTLFHGCQIFFNVTQFMET